MNAASLSQISQLSITIISITGVVLPTLSIDMVKKHYKRAESQSAARPMIEQPAGYRMLSRNESLYKGSLHILKNPQFGALLSRLTLDLSPLPRLSEEDFFIVLQENEEMRLSLESCLIVFGRKCYCQTVIDEPEKETISDRDEVWQKYRFLLKLVAMIYNRISAASTPALRQLVYNNWLIDIPKMLQLCAIYGQSNPQLTRQILAQAYQNENYHYDTNDFWKLLYDHMEWFQNSLESDIDFSPKSLKAHNYGNRQHYVMSQAAKSIFKVVDLVHNMHNILRYFPKLYAQELATDYHMQERLIVGVCQFMVRAENQWNLGNYFRFFEELFEYVRLSVVEYWMSEFDIIRTVWLSKEANDQLKGYAEDTYKTFCMLRTHKDSKIAKYFTRLINMLIEHTPETVFFIEAHELTCTQLKFQHSILECRQYERKYRQEKLQRLNLDYDQTFLRFKETIKLFKQAEKREKGKQHQKHLKKREKELREKKAQALDHQRIVIRLKYGNFGKQYYDEPEQQSYQAVGMPNEHQVLNKPDPNLSFSYYQSAPPPAAPQKKNKVKWVKKKQPLESTDLSFNYDKSKANIEDLSFIAEKKEFSLDLSGISNAHQASIVQPSMDMEDIMNQITEQGPDFKKSKKEPQPPTELSLQQQSLLNILEDLGKEDESQGCNLNMQDEPLKFNWNEDEELSFDFA